MRIKAARYLSVLILSAIVTYASASENSGEYVDPITSSQLEKLLLEFQSMENRALDGIKLPSSDQITKLRNTLQELEKNWVSCTKQSPVSSAAQAQVASPSGPVRPNSDPPGQIEIAKMQEATEQSHLPGPPIEETQPVSPPSQTDVEYPKSLEITVEYLDSIERDLSSAQPDTLKILNRLRQARLDLEQAKKDMECSNEND